MAYIKFKSQKEKKKENVAEESLAYNFPKMMKEIKSQIQEF